MSDRIRTRSRIGNYAIAPLWLVMNRDVKDFAIRLFVYIAAKHADRDSGTCYPTRRTMAEALGVARSTIDTGLRQLVDAGALQIQHRYVDDDPGGVQMSSLYTVIFDAPEASTDGAEVDRETGQGVSRESGIRIPKNRHTVSRQTGHKIKRINQNHSNQNHRTADDDAGGFDLVAQDAGESAPKEPPPTARCLAAFYHDWKTRYGTAIDRRPAHPAQMKRIVDERGVDNVLTAIGRYFADEYYADKQHPLGLFVVNVGKMIAAATARASASGPVYDADAAEERLERQREREARAEQVMADAVAAFNAMSADGQAALRRIAEAELQEYQRTTPDWRPSADECRRRIAERMVGLLVDHGRGRSMAETAQDFEPRANAQGVA